MKITCPSCGTGGSISLFMADTDARRAVLAAARLPSDCGMATLKYISLFTPRDRFLTSTRAARLITECCDMIISGVDFDRDHIKAPSYIWRQAMLEMIENEKIDRPIKNHHYLLRIVQTMLNKRSDVNQAERADARRNSETVRVRSTSMQPIAEALPGALPDIPADVRPALLKLAREALLGDGFKEKFLIAPLIEQKAKELYADGYANGGQP